MFVCVCVGVQDNSKSYGRIFLKFWGNVRHGINYKWFNFGGDPAGILDSGSLWNFPYNCVKLGIREPLAKRIWWRHLANDIALAEVPGGYDCFLVLILHLMAMMLHIDDVIECWDAVQLWWPAVQTSTKGLLLLLSNVDHGTLRSHLLSALSRNWALQTRIFSIERRFWWSKSWFSSFKETFARGHQRAVPRKSRYFTIVGQPFVKTVAGRQP